MKYFLHQLNKKYLKARILYIAMQKYDIESKIFSFINIVFINFIRFIFIPDLKKCIEKQFYVS